ncbi:tyrosine-type recombinase/integrase [Frigoribacterium faeni]|nr:tyrosine-type recombinase/integrase [Frigoribacterium faeni]
MNQPAAMRRTSRATVRRVPKDETQPLLYWQASIETDPDRYGKRRRRVVRSKDPDECQRKLYAALAEEARKVRRPVQPLLPPMPALHTSGSTGEWVQYWYEAIAKMEVAPKTAATYKSMIQGQILPTLGDVPLIELSAADVRSLSAAVRDKGLSGATALQAHRVLSASLTQAYREGYVHRNVARLTKPPKKDANRLATLTVYDAQQILKEAIRERLGSRWAAALLTGARQGELLGLELDRISDTLDLSWQLQRLTWVHGCKSFCGWQRGAECPERFVDAPAGHERRELAGGLWLTRPKSAAGWRVIPLVEPLRTLIDARIEAAQQEHNPHGLLWTMDTGRRRRDTQGRPIDPGIDSKNWHRLLDQVGVPHVRLHDARHAAIDLLYEAGAPEIVIKDIVGHASIDMSRRYRGRRSMTPMQDALKAMAQILESRHGA